MATPALSVWVVDDDESVRWVLEQALQAGAHVPPRVRGRRPVLRRVASATRPTCSITDIRMPGQTGLELMEQLREARPATCRSS